MLFMVALIFFSNVLEVSWICFTFNVLIIDPEAQFFNIFAKCIIYLLVDDNVNLLNNIAIKFKSFDQ